MDTCNYIRMALAHGNYGDEITTTQEMQKRHRLKVMLSVCEQYIVGWHRGAFKSQHMNPLSFKEVRDRLVPIIKKNLQNGEMFQKGIQKKLKGITENSGGAKQPPEAFKINPRTLPWDNLFQEAKTSTGSMFDSPRSGKVAKEQIPRIGERQEGGEGQEGITSKEVEEYARNRNLQKLRLLAIIIGYLTALDLSTSTYLYNIDMCALFFRRDADPSRILDGAGYSTTGGGAWPDAFHVAAEAAIAEICQMLDIDADRFLRKIEKKKKGDFTHQQELVIGLTYIQLASTIGQCPMFLRFCEGVVRLERKRSGGKGVPQGYYKVTDAELRQIAVIKQTNPKIKVPALLDQLRVWANQTGLRPEGHSRSLPAIRWVLKTRENRIHQMMEDIQG